MEEDLDSSQGSAAAPQKGLEEEDSASDTNKGF
jgi:hypothetical protein